MGMDSATRRVYLLPGVEQAVAVQSGVWSVAVGGVLPQVALGTGAWLV